MLAKDKKSLFSLIDKAVARVARLSVKHGPGTSETLYICNVIDGCMGFGRKRLKATDEAHAWLAAEIRSIVVASHGDDVHWKAMALPHSLASDLNARTSAVRDEVFSATYDWDRACDEAQLLWDTTSNCFRLGVLHALRVKAEQLPEEETHHG